MDRHRGQIPVAEPPADLRGAFGGRERGVEIAGGLRGEDPAHRHVAVPEARRQVRARPAARAGATRPRSPCPRARRARSRDARRRSPTGYRTPRRSRRTRAGGGRATRRAPLPTSARRPPAPAQRDRDRAFRRSCRRQRYRSCCGLASVGRTGDRPVDGFAVECVVADVWTSVARPTSWSSKTGSVRTNPGSRSRRSTASPSISFPTRSEPGSTTTATSRSRTTRR